jgi:hypothetical protein
MIKSLKEKAGNEILQTLIIIAVIGALAITICILISNKLKATSKQSLNDVGNGLGEGVNEAMQDRDTTFNGY